MHRARTALLVGGAALALLAFNAHAKRVIWVANNNESEDGGQHYAQNPQPGDIIQREAAGTSLATARGKLAAGDTFIIITHGQDGSITIGGNSVDGFRGTGTTGAGTGAGCGTPTEIDPITEDNITVILHVCHSEDDPDGGGSQISVADSLRALVTGTGSSVTGKAGTVTFTCQVVYSNPAAPNGMQIGNLTTCLAAAAATAGFAGPNRINDWVNSMGGAAKQTAVTAAIDACQAGPPPANDLPDVEFQYTQPSWPDSGDPFPSDIKPYDQWDSTDGAELFGGVVPLEEIVLIESCGDGCGAPGVIPTVGEWGMIIMAGMLMVGGGFILRRSIV